MFVKKSLFSLIELLIVIAVLSLIAALLMPSFKKAQESAMRLSCKSNTRSTAQAWNLFLEDNEFQLFQYATHSRKI
jgi:prepilin-type N-terminal cleavage/methylation domain-containing protein